ncbi:hypothetical protein [Desertivirga brevis]|uniref:hypothetical protein n=1 Tax=Desertivirga brevis TaxID=2810310 RepID=UPI001A97614B|nr:hypothetical protein [Pedobacter sp. SYSU D00873]
MEIIEQNHIQKQTQCMLINGQFSANDALEIMKNLINGKINFHNLKNFSSQVRFGQADEHSLKRMEELREQLHSITQLVNHCREQGKTLQIQSTISIEVI